MPDSNKYKLIWSPGAVQGGKPKSYSFTTDVPNFKLDETSFNAAFRSARKAKIDSFTYKGKKYNTKLIPKKDSDEYIDSKNFLLDYYKNNQLNPLTKYDSIDLAHKYGIFKYGTTWLDYYESNKEQINDYSNPLYDSKRDTLDMLDEHQVFKSPDFLKYINNKSNINKENIDRLNSKDYYFSITNQKPKDLKEDGYLDKKNKKIFFYADNSPINTTYVHELSHKSDVHPWKLTPEINVDYINKNRSAYPSLNSQEKFDYLTDDSEIQARKMSTLYYLKRRNKPYTNISKETFDSLYTDQKDMPYDVKQLLELYSGQKSDLLNYLNGNHPKNFAKGGKVKKYGDGDKVKPIIVNDKNDPRLQAYQDSLDLYNLNNRRLSDLIKTHKLAEEDYKLEYLESLPKSVYTNADFIKGKGDNYKRLGYNFESYENYNIDPVKAWKLTHIYDKYKAPKFIKNIGLFDTKSEGFVDYGLVYPKPVQPVVYQPKTNTSKVVIPKLKKTPKVRSIIPKGLSTYNPSLPPITDDYRVMPPLPKKDFQSYSAAGYPMIKGKTVPAGYINKPGNKADKSNAEIKEYKDGDIVKPNYNELVNSGFELASMITSDATNKPDYSGRVMPDKPINHTGEYALKYGTQGAAIGSQILPGWGTAIGAGVGAIGGATAGIIQKHNQDNKYVTALNRFNKEEAYQEDMDKQYDNIYKDLAGMEYAMGGAAEPVPIEIEKKEVALMPNGRTINFKAPSHKNGGQKVVVPEDTLIFSDRLKMDNKTFAAHAKPLRTDKLFKITEDKNSSIIDKKTAEKMINKNNKKLTHLFNLQEAMKEQDAFDKFKKAYGGMIKKYWGGGTADTSWDLLRKVYEDGIQKQQEEYAKRPYVSDNLKLNPVTIPTIPTNNGKTYMANTDNIPNTGITPPIRNLPFKKQTFAKLDYSPVTTMSNPSDITKIRQSINGYNPNMGKVAAENLSGTSSADGPPKPGNNFDWGKAAGQLGKWGLNNIGNLSYLINEGKKYDKVTARTINPEYMNDTAAINDIRRAGTTSGYLARNTFANNPGQLLSALSGISTGVGKNIAGVKMAYDNQNTAIKNQVKQFNSQTQTGADIATAQNKGQMLTNYYNALKGLGENTNKQMLGYNYMEMDEKLLPIMIKLNPWMSKYLKTNG